jgi:hypothetical protein
MVEGAGLYACRQGSTRPGQNLKDPLLWRFAEKKICCVVWSGRADVPFGVLGGGDVKLLVRNLRYQSANDAPRMNGSTNTLLKLRR